MKNKYSVPKIDVKISALRMTILAGSDSESVVIGDRPILDSSQEFDTKVKGNVD